MDERLRYEQLIGEKLQSLPAPDMRDAIWARIKTQLDLDMPTDDGEGGSSSQSPTGPKIIGWGLSVVIIALITSFFISKNQPKTNPYKNNPGTTEKVLSPSIQNNSPPLQKDNSIKNTNNHTVNQNASQKVVNDSAMQKSVVNNTLLADDSVRSNGPLPTISLSSPTIVDTSLKVEKGKGVRGLSDSDYRIVPKNKN